LDIKSLDNIPYVLVDRFAICVKEITDQHHLEVCSAPVNLIERRTPIAVSSIVIDEVHKKGVIWVLFSWTGNVIHKEDAVFPRSSPC